jgi:hypothetical protein
MAMEMHVLFRGKLPGKAALARAMKELGFPLTIPSAVGSLEQQKGFLPMRLRREETGVEFDVFDGRDAVEDVAGRDVDPAFQRSANLRWGGDKNEMLAALCAAAALAKLTGGVVLDDEEDRLLGADEAVELAKQHLKAVAKTPDKQPGTRPADIKRYLKPLLQQRSDLVLIGRMLVIRPVRHILRGAFLDRTSDKYSFRVWRYIKPLYDGPDGLGYGDYLLGGGWDVWQPHFEALLMNSLAEDIFARVGPMTTLTDLATALSGTDRFHTARVRALVLAGERDRAADYIREVEHHDPSHPYWESWARTQREFLARDIDAVCAEFHAKEAETAKALKLEPIWEPSRFPVEVPTQDRTSMTADPFFATAPRIETPPSLLQEVPDRPGDIRFAKDELRRDGRVMLLVPLSRDEAEGRHRNGEDYVLAARAIDGLLVVLRSTGGWDRHDPQRAEWTVHGIWRWIMELYGSQYSVRVSVDRDRDEDGLLHLQFFVVHAHSQRYSIWNCSVDSRDGEVKIHDDREQGNRIYTKRLLTDAERRIIAMSVPEFGDFEGLLGRVRAWLRHSGFGEII